MARPGAAQGHRADGRLAVSSARRAAYQMMVQSVAGLAAKAVNEGRGDELVWVGTEHLDVEEWLRRLLASHRASARSKAS